MISTFLKRMNGGGTVPRRKSFSKISWSWIGAFIGIYLIAILNKFLFSDIENGLFLVGSFGASAVLIYGAPQVEFSQPRNLIGGHILSAIVGVTAYKVLHVDISLLSAIAVSLSIVFMHFSRTLHPPGGATALIAVIGSDKVHSLGYLYIIYPIASGAFILLFVALIVNNLSKNQKRHYPKYWI